MIHTERAKIVRHPGMATRAASQHLEQVYGVIEAYYTGKVSTHGAVPRGVDWESSAAQELRFAQLLEVCDFSHAFSLNDVGCGYGALLEFLPSFRADTRVDYLGIDISAAMIRHARRLRRKRRRGSFVVADASPRIADYSIASGLFNVKLDQPTALWESFIANTMASMHKTSRRGFAVNFLTLQAAKRAPQHELYRTSPQPWIKLCEREFGLSVKKLQGYGLREFTLLCTHT
ncbi:MAG TPA: class I SAM-dependent methyltransferase [Stellaceae bacterium]|nr:class I SAM-dependent methyltransferase [Stellaceae bacterium]